MIAAHNFSSRQEQNRSRSACKVDEGQGREVGRRERMRLCYFLLARSCRSSTCTRASGGLALTIPEDVLRAPVHLTTGSLRANAFLFPARSGYAASRQRLFHGLRCCRQLSFQKHFSRLHSGRSTSSIGHLGPARSSVSDLQLFRSSCRCGANLLHCRSPSSFALQSASITWERIASRRRLAFSSHLVTSTD